MTIVGYGYNPSSKTEAWIATLSAAAVGDFDGDDDADLGDLAVLALAWNCRLGDPGWNPDCDISDPKDDVIDFRDIKVFFEDWPRPK